MIEEVPEEGYQPIELQDAGELIFKRLQSHGAVFYQNKFDPVPIKQRSTNTKFLVINSDRQYKTYQIKDKEIKLISSHTIDFPVFAKGYWTNVSADHLHYFFKKKNIEKREKAVQFFSEHGIDWETPSWLTFRVGVGNDLPENLIPYFLGESKYEETEKQDSKIRDIFDNQKSLMNPGICLFMGKNNEKADQGSPEAEQVYYLSKFDQKYPDFAKHFFRFNLKPEKLPDYQRKIVKDFEKISPKISKLNQFFEHCQGFSIINYEPGLVKKYMPFTQVDNYMVTVGLLDLRKRTIPVKRLVSIYELLDQLEFKSTPSVEFFNIVKIDYCVELDLLIVDARMNFYFEPEDRENIHSVILNNIEERVAEGKLGFLSEINDGRIKEVQKIRFKVWGLLKSRKKRIEVDIMGYPGRQLFQKGQGMMTTFDEGTSEIRVCIIRNQSSSQQASCNQLQQNELERRSKKVVKKNKKIKTTVIEISKENLFKFSGIRAQGLTTALMINENNLLVVSSRDLLLLDINSKEIISSCRFCQNIPCFFKNTKIYDNIMAHLILRLNIIEIFEISAERGYDYERPSFEFLGTLNFSNCVENLFEIDRLLALRRVEDEVYELIVVAKMMESAECAVVTKMIFLVQFRLPGENSKPKKEQNPEIIYMSSVCDVDFSQENIKAYIKNDLWNYIFFDGVETSGIQNDYDDETTLVFNDLHRFQPSDYQIAQVHLNRDFIFIELVGETDKLLKVIQALGEDEDGELVEAEVKRTISLKLTAQVYFDEVTDLPRIFIFEQNEVELRIQLTVLDNELDEIETLSLPWLEHFTTFKIVSSETLHIIGKEPTGDEAHSNRGDRDQGVPNVSLLFNLKNKSIQRLVVEGEGPLLYTPHDFGRGRLLGFIRDFHKLQEKLSDGIYFSTSSI